MRDANAATVQVSLAEGRRPSQRATLPVQPMDMLAAPIAGSLRKLPPGTAACFDFTGTLPWDYLEQLVARFSLATALGAEWGMRQGPLTFDAYFVWPGERDSTVIRVLASTDRLLVLTHDEPREEVPALEPRWVLPETPALVETAVLRSNRFSLDWAAAAQTQLVLERLRVRV